MSKRPVDRVQLKFVRTVNSGQSPSILVFEDDLGGSLNSVLFDAVKAILILAGTDSPLWVPATI